MERCNEPQPPRILTIAGSDSGGGAGIEADLKTFTALGVYGMAAITSITAQNTIEVTAVYDLPPDLVAEQIDVVIRDIGVDAAKTGMLSHAGIVEAVANAVRRSRAGIQDPDRPLGSFIFLGPTGVGKTELARALAEFLFDTEQAMVRIDMSEFMEKHSVSRLIGAPPGYVGFEEGGYLTEAVRRRPYSVVLFDEIEKAHPEVFNVLLQILDDGRITDSHGRTVDFKNTILIMTSNIGSGAILDYDESRFEQMKAQVMEILRGHFRPEFLNRIDEIVFFHRLTREDLVRIVEIQTKRLAKRLEEKHIEIDLTKSAKEFLVEKGYDPTFGARPLKRAIQSELLDKIALDILAGKFKDGDKLKADAKGGVIVFSKS